LKVFFIYSQFSASLAFVAFIIAITFSVPVSAEEKNGGIFVDQLLAESNFTPIYTAMEKYFPVEANRLKTSLTRTAHEVNIDRLDLISEWQLTKMSEATENVFNAFYQRHGSDAYNAPDITLRSVIQAHIQPLKYVQERGNDCNTYLIYGANSPLVDTNIPYALVEAGAITKFEAMHKGSLTSTKRPQMTEYSNDLRQQVFAGMDQEEIELLASPDINNPKTCSANIKFFENIWRAEGHDAELNRARSVLILLGQ
jgi:hypothetical protein